MVHVDGTQAEQRMLHIDGHRLAALVSGLDRPGPPVVLIHGVSVSINLWPAALPVELLSRRPWISLSLPGHFPSTAPEGFDRTHVTADLFGNLASRAIRDLVGERSVHLVGWSTGGFTALNVALQAPEQITSLTSICGFANGSWGSIPGLLQMVAARGRMGMNLFGRLFRATGRSDFLFRQVMKALAADRKAYSASPITNPTLEVMQGDFQQLDTAALGSMYAGLRTLNIRDRLSEITSPTLIIAGEKDPVIPVEESRLLVQCIPDATEFLLHDCGHMVFAEAGDVVADRLQRWFAEFDE